MVAVSLLSTALCAQAPQCTPYVIFKEDFGGTDASNPQGPPLPAGTTTYSYSGNTPVEDGLYGIRKQVQGHGGPNGTWHQITDHSGGGYLMLINASYEPGLFYQQKISGLCQGMTFFFSAWVANLMKASASGPMDPELKFVILNPHTQEVIGTYTTGALARHDQPTWEQYGIAFDLPSGLSSVVLQIFNNAEGGNGNDLVLDDITFSICGPPITTVASGMYDNGPNICSGQQVALEAHVEAGAFHQPVYQWQFGTDTASWQDRSGADQAELILAPATASDSGWFRLVVAEKGNLQLPHCRIASAPVPVRVWQKPRASIATNSPVCEGTPLSLNVSGSFQLTGQWSGPGGFQSHDPALHFQSATPAQSGTYRLNAHNPGGCTVQLSKTVQVQPNDLSVAFDASDSILCEGQHRTLTATNPGATYLWNTGSTAPAITVDTAGIYRVTVQKAVCVYADSIRLYGLRPPKVALGTDTSVCEGEPFLLQATDPAAETCRWSSGSPDSVFVVTHPGTYQVLLQNHCGTDRDTIHIAMEPCSNELLFPTAFSPNNDGINDRFRPKVLFGLEAYALQVFDRWGKKVFQTGQADAGWDGTRNGQRLPSGSYIWIAKYTRSKDRARIIQKGTIALIR